MEAVHDGTVDLAEVTALGAVDGFKRGSVNLALTGQGSGADQYVLDGKAKVVNASYAMEYFWIDGVNATTRLHITPDEITLPDLVGPPPSGRDRQCRSSLSPLAGARQSGKGSRGPGDEHSRPGARGAPDHSP